MKKNYIILLIIGILVAGITLFIFLGGDQKIESNKIKVTTSFYPLYFLADQIGGEKIDLINITPAGIEPHDYEPTARDIARIETSKMLILNGNGFEPWEGNIQQNLNGKDIVIVMTSEGLASQQILEEGETITDPHIWLSPPLAKQMADKIAQGFIQVDPGNKDYYLQNADLLKTKLDGLDKEYKDGLANCKENNIITSHAAFGYLATTYGLHQVPISGLSPDADPSPQELVDIVKFAKANNIKYIFFESLISPKLSETIASEVGATTLVLNPIEDLTDEEISQGKSYFTEMGNNLANLQIALQCQR